MVWGFFGYILLYLYIVVGNWEFDFYVKNNLLLYSCFCCFSGFNFFFDFKLYVVEVCFI